MILRSHHKAWKITIWMDKLICIVNFAAEHFALFTEDTEERGQTKHLFWICMVLFESNTL